ncbi:hypothetical protein Tco_0979824 [Tanacetum coccineum]
MLFPMYPPPSPPTNSDRGHVVQESSIQSIGGVDTSIMGSLGHGHDDVGARSSRSAAPSHVARLVDYDDGMDKDDV